MYEIHSMHLSTANNQRVRGTISIRPQAGPLNHKFHTGKWFAMATRDGMREDARVHTSVCSQAFPHYARVNKKRNHPCHLDKTRSLI